MRNTRFGRGRRHRRQSETVFQPQPEQDQQTRLLQQDQQHQLIQQSQQDRSGLQGHQDQSGLQGQQDRSGLQGQQDQSEDICPTRKHFIHPTVAFSVKGKQNLFSIILNCQKKIGFIQISICFFEPENLF